MKNTVFGAITCAALGLAFFPSQSFAGIGDEYRGDAYWRYWRYSHLPLEMMDEHDSGWHEGWRHRHHHGCVIIKKWRHGERMVIEKCG